jgi:hypothetical protein
MLRRPWRALFRITSYYDGSFACPPGSVPHLIVGDLSVLGLEGGKEVIQGLQPSVVIGLQSERVIDPGAYALGVASSDGLLRHRQ